MRNTTLIWTMLLLSTFTVGLSAQDFGIRAGINASDASIDFGNADINTEGSNDFVAGVFVDIPIGAIGLSLQPELNYMGRGYDYSISVLDYKVEYTASYFDLGGLVKFNFNREGPFGAYIGAGPFLNYALKAKIVENGEERDVDFDVDGIKKNELTIAVALGIVFGKNTKVFGEFRYVYGLTDQTEDNSSDLKQRSIMLTAGLIF